MRLRTARSSIAALSELAEMEDDPRARTTMQIGQVQALALTDQWEEASQLCRRLEPELPSDQADQRAMFQAIRSVTAIFGADDPDGYRIEAYCGK